MLGCLVEKELTTPQQYPLTLNALTVAANQATNRDPVVTLDEAEVLAAIDELRAEHLARVVLPSHGRSVKRFRHVLGEDYGLDVPRYALLATLLLRGPQTVGALRARTERMVEFSSTADIQHELTVMADHPGHLVRMLLRRAGQKEDRWQQFLAAPWGADLPVAFATDDDGVDRHDPVGDDTEAGARHGNGVPDALLQRETPTGSTALDGLRLELDELRAEVAALRQDLDSLREGLGG